MNIKYKDINILYNVFMYVYIRTSVYKENNINLLKLGITTKLKERESTYVTGEYIREKFICVYEISSNDESILAQIDKRLKIILEKYNKQSTGGTEFYDPIIKDKVEQILKDYQGKKYTYKKLSEDEIMNIERCNRIKSIIDKLDFMKKQCLCNFVKYIRDRKNKKLNTTIKPNEQQQYILDNIKSFYDKNSIGKIIWACGLGKALLSILIAQLLQFKTVIIGVSSIYLLKQMSTEILKIFPNKKNILFVCGLTNHKDDNPDKIIKYTSNTSEICSFLSSNTSDCKFIITTYHSCFKLVNNNINVDFKIGDEAHHLVGKNKKNHNQFISFHNIQSKKTLFMTATEKIIDTKLNSIDNISMNNEKIFGKHIGPVKSIAWAIENKKITDYNVIVLMNTDDQINYIINKVSIPIMNKDLFLSSYMALKSIESYDKLSHILIYTNTIEDANLVENYINSILNANICSINKNDIYNKALHSNSLDRTDSTMSISLEKEINIFKKYKYGIIPCVYIFGEGFDLPKLNGVCIAGNMNSEIRIVQYLLRPNRLDINQKDKISHIIIPYLCNNNRFHNSDKSFNKVRQIITKLKFYDKNIEQKIKVSGTNSKRNNSNSNNSTKTYDDDSNIFRDNKNKLNNLKLRLRYSKTLTSDFTAEQDEYEYVKSINKLLNLKSKEEYSKCEENHENFIPDAQEYFKKKGIWNGWYDFLGVDTSIFIQTKEEWIKFCNVNKITSSNYLSKCNEYKQLPKNPCDLFKGDFNLKILDNKPLSRHRRR